MSRTLGNAFLSTKSFEQLVTMAIPRLSAPHPRSTEEKGARNYFVIGHWSLVTPPKSILLLAPVLRGEGVGG